MRKDQNLPQQRIIGRPFCEVCKAQLWLAFIEPDKPDYDKRTFECPVCPNVIVKVVKYRRAALRHLICNRNSSRTSCS